MKHNLIFGIAYTIVYFPLAFLAINAEGKGPLIFLIPALTWVLVLVALFLSKRLYSLRNRIAFVLLLLTHYAITLKFGFDSWDDQYPRIERMVSFGELWFIFVIVGWYILGQSFIWASLFRKVPEDAGKPQLP